MRNLVNGLHDYAIENEGRFPEPKKWIEELYPVVYPGETLEEGGLEGTVFVIPANGNDLVPRDRSFAMNQNLTRASNGELNRAVFENDAEAMLLIEAISGENGEMSVDHTSRDRIEAATTRN